jgi:SAM-dependent methyltransferase
MGLSACLEVLCCTSCQNGKIEVGQTQAICLGCGAKFQVRGGQVLFSSIEEDVTTDFLDRIKYAIKKNYKLYNFLKDTIAPVYFDRSMKKFLRAVTASPGAKVLNLGSGNTSLGLGICNVDLIAYGNVHVVSDLTFIPFQPGTVDAVVLNSVLEHVPHPDRVLKEVKRILAPGGQVYAAVPFMMPFHASPYDYWRWTREGLKTLFKDYEVRELKNEGGPTSALLWMFQEWLSILLSFGSKKVHSIVYLMLLVLTWPIKYVDVIIGNWASADQCTSGFIVIAKKT